ncbi:DUF1579 family protein [Methanoculleus oceani]|nr:DUF1579 family protein [Methanoculleus sp. CWC-02]
MTERETPAETTARWEPTVRKPGPETEALARFHPNGTWTGTVQADGMGPGSPEMEARGRADCEWIINGLWRSCRFEQDQFVAGEKVVTWKAHWIAGWDARTKEYRGMAVDSNGISMMFRGRLEGDRLIMESMEPAVSLRFIWDAADPRAIIWMNEIMTEDGSWRLIEEYVIRPQEPVRLSGPGV